MHSSFFLPGHPSLLDPFLQNLDLPVAGTIQKLDESDDAASVHATVKATSTSQMDGCLLVGSILLVLF